MIHRLIAALVVLGVTTATAHADLRYTMRLEARQSTVPVPAPANPLLPMLGAMVMSVMLPEGPISVVVTTGEKGTRVDYEKAYLIIPAGASMLVRPDGSAVVLNPSAKTFWKLPDASALTVLAGQRPVVTTTRTGDFTDVAGLRAERVGMTVKMSLPLPGAPAEISLAGDVWIADRYKQFAKSASGPAGPGGGLALAGSEQIAALGLPLRSLLRGDLFGGQEVETRVTSIAEVPTAAGLFDVPAGFTEIPPPRMALPGLGGR